MEKKTYTYLYDGHKVFVAYPEDMPGVKDIEGNVPSSSDKHIYPMSDYNGCETLLTDDDDIPGNYGGEREIDYAYCTNPENEEEQTYGVWSCAWIDADEIDDDEEE